MSDVTFQDKDYYSKYKVKFKIFLIKIYYIKKIIHNYKTLKIDFYN